MALLAITGEPDPLEPALGLSQQRPMGLGEPRMAAAGMTFKPRMAAAGSSPSLQNKGPGCGVGSTSRGWRWKV